jgi:hypothetical protein
MLNGGNISSNLKSLTTSTDATPLAQMTSLSPAYPRANDARCKAIAAAEFSCASSLAASRVEKGVKGNAT